MKEKQCELALDQRMARELARDQWMERARALNQRVLAARRGRETATAGIAGVEVGAICQRGSGVCAAGVGIGRPAGKDLPGRGEARPPPR